MRAISVHQTGGPELLQLEEIDLPEPGPGEVRVMIRAVGVNYIDIYNRKGQYKSKLPYTPGSEAGGEVHALGEGVEGLAVGDAPGVIHHHALDEIEFERVAEPVQAQPHVGRDAREGEHPHGEAGGASEQLGHSDTPLEGWKDTSLIVRKRFVLQVRYAGPLRLAPLRPDEVASGGGRHGRRRGLGRGHGSPHPCARHSGCLDCGVLRLPPP